MRGNHATRSGPAKKKRTVCDFCKREKRGVKERYDPIMKRSRPLCNECATFKALQHWELNPELAKSITRLPDGSIVVPA